MGLDQFQPGIRCLFESLERELGLLLLSVHGSDIVVASRQGILDLARLGAVYHALENLDAEFLEFLVGLEGGGVVMTLVIDEALPIDDLGQTLLEFDILRMRPNEPILDSS